MNVGDKVRFIGRDEKYHSDFAQLLGQIGVIVSVHPNSCFVVFEGFVDSVGDVEFVCWDEELELVEAV